MQWPLHVEDVRGSEYWGLWCPETPEHHLGRIKLIPMLNGFASNELDTSRPVQMMIPASWEGASGQRAAIKLLLDRRFVITDA